MIEIAWTHWFMLGIILIIMETFTLSFVLFWFGLSAILVSGLDYLYGLNLIKELSFMIFFSILFISIWFFYIKKKGKNSIEGQSQIELNKIGVVLNKNEPTQGRYKVLFSESILGSREWIAISEEELEIEDKVELLEIKSQLAKVKKIK